MFGQALRRARPILAMLALGALLGARSAAAAPLAGTYVVGSTGVYATPAAAAADVVANGVSGPVTFQIQPGTYSVNTTLTAISGANSTNRITFVSQSGVASSVVLQGDGS
ncbi:MAG: hypothetical protein ACRDL7_14765, partial [Gaiellaceae bacterium]